MEGGMCYSFVRSSRICLERLQFNRAGTGRPSIQRNLLTHSLPLRMSLVQTTCKHKPRSTSSNGGGDGDTPKSRVPDQDAILKAISEVSKAGNRVAKHTFIVMGGTTSESTETKWKFSSGKANSYPMVSRFTAIGIGGDDFVHSMIFAVESVLESPIPKAWVQKRLSSRGKYVSVKIGPVFVNSREQAHAVYDAMRRDVRMKYFL